MKFLFLFLLLESTLCFGEHEYVNYVLENNHPMPPDMLSFIFDPQAKDEFKKIDFPDADKLNLEIARKLSEVKDAQYRQTLAFAKNVTTPIIVGAGAALSMANPPLGLTATTWGVATNTVVAFAAQQTDNLISFFQDRQNEAIETVSMNILDEYNKRYGEALSNHFNKNMSVDEIISKINGGITSPLMSKVYGDMTPTQQKRVSFQMAIHLKDLMAKGYHELEQELDSKGEGLDHAISDIKKIEKTFSGFSALQEKRIHTIIEKQKIITDKVNLTLEISLDNRERIERNSNEINFTNSLLYGHLTSKEKREFLEHHRDSLSADDYKKESDHLELITTRDEICETTIKIANGAHDLYQIADNLGLFSSNPNMQEKAANVLKVANALAGAVSGFYTGNYLGAVNSVSILFKKGSPDIAGLRHNALMGALDDMRQENYQYYKDIMEGQRLLSVQMDAHFTDLYKKLDNLKDFIKSENNEVRKLIEAHDRHLDDLQKVVIKDYNQGFHQCEFFLSLIKRYQSKDNEYFHSGRFRNYKSFYNFFINKSDIVKTITACNKFLDRNVVDFIHDSPFYLSQNYRSDLFDDEANINFLRKIARLFMILPRAERLRLYPMLAMPIHSLEAIDLKYKFEVGFDKERQPFDDGDLRGKYAGILPDHERSVLSDYISPQILLRTYSVVLEISPYLPFFENGKVKTEREVLTSPFTSRFDDILSGLIRRIDIAIIQQNLLQGDVALPHLYNIFHLKSEDYKDQEAQSNVLLMQNDLRMLLSDNRNLGRNFLLYSTREKFSRETLVGYKNDYIVAYEGVMSGKFRLIGNGLYEEKMKPIISSVRLGTSGHNQFFYLGADAKKRGFDLPTFDQLSNGAINENNVTATYLFSLREQLNKIRFELYSFDSLSKNEKILHIKNSFNFHGDL